VLFERINLPFFYEIVSQLNTLKNTVNIHNILKMMQIWKLYEIVLILV
jgi:hypothetical protein